MCLRLICAGFQTEPNRILSLDVADMSLIPERTAKF